MFCHGKIYVAIVSQIICSNLYFKIKPASFLSLIFPPTQAAYILSKHFVILGLLSLKYYILSSHCTIFVAFISHIMHCKLFFKINPDFSIPLVLQPNQSAYILSTHWVICVPLVSQLTQCNTYLKIKVASPPSCIVT